MSTYERFACKAPRVTPREVVLAGIEQNDEIINVSIDPALNCPRQVRILVRQVIALHPRAESILAGGNTAEFESSVRRQRDRLAVPSFGRADAHSHSVGNRLARRP